MSDFIKDLAKRVVQHPAFTKAVADVVATVLEEQLRTNLGGEKIYIPKVGGSQSRAERDGLIRSQFTGSNYAELAKRFSLTLRQIRRIVHAKPRAA